MYMTIGRAAAAAIFLGPSAVQAFWILSHGSLTQDRLDPIVNPGIVAGHVHNIVGASNFAPLVTTEKLLASNCTTSPVQADMSNYWAPQLYHRNFADNTFTLIPISFVQTYYLNRDGPHNKEIFAFPPGLRMLAGNPYRTTYNASNNADKAVSFVCLNYKGGSSDSNTFPTTNCPDGMRAQIVFPSCWDGVNLDSADHKSHMSYPVGGAPDSGDCPASHPKKLITLFNEWVFSVGDFDFVPSKNYWVFSFGGEDGLGMHADFVNGWDQDVLEAAVKQCTGNLFGDVESCAPFKPSANRDVARKCKIASTVDEDIVGPLKALPGCNPVPLTKGAQCPGLATPAIKGFKGGIAPVPSSTIPASTSIAASSSSAASSSTSSSGSTSAVSTSSSAAGTPVPSSTSSAQSSSPSLTTSTPTSSKAGSTSTPSSAPGTPTPSSTSSTQSSSPSPTTSAPTSSKAGSTSTSSSAAGTPAPSSASSTQSSSLSPTTSTPTSSKAGGTSSTPAKPSTTVPVGHTLPVVSVTSTTRPTSTSGSCTAKPSATKGHGHHHHGPKKGKEHGDKSCKKIKKNKSVKAHRRALSRMNTH